MTGSPTTIKQLPHTASLSLSLPNTHPNTHTQYSTQAPTAFYSGDHNYLMMELLVSQLRFCTHDPAVNNLAPGARKVVP